MSDANVGGTIEKILSKIKGRKEEDLKKVPIGIPEKIYLKAIPLRELDDLDLIKNEVKSGNILIIKVSPLAKKGLDDVKRAVNELCEFTELVGGDIARLGEERIVITPAFVRIWREKTDISSDFSTEA